jgi:hypothetical protein
MPRWCMHQGALQCNLAVVVLGWASGCLLARVGNKLVISTLGLSCSMCCVQTVVGQEHSMHCRSAVLEQPLLVWVWPVTQQL